MWINLCLNSVLSSRESNRKRFFLDTALLNVTRIHLTAFECTGANYLISVPSYIYYSEIWDDRDQIPFFKTQLPCGKYDFGELVTMLNCILNCVECVNHATSTPQNLYTASICPQTLILTIRSNGKRPYALHGSHTTAAGKYPAVVKTVLDKSTLSVVLHAPVDCPLAVGAVVSIFSDELDVVTAQLVSVVDGCLILRTVGSSTCKLDGVESISISPFSSRSACLDVLGFSEYDTTADSWINVTGCGLLSNKHCLIGCDRSHGALPGDGLLLQRSSGETTVTTVRSIPSFSHVSVTPSKTFVNGYTRCKLVGLDSTSSNRNGNIGTTTRGVYGVDLGRNRRVVLVRLWLGSNELKGMVVCRQKETLEVFGRLQLRQQRDHLVSFSGSGDSSAIGERTVDPPLLRVQYIDVEVLTESGDTLTTGEWTMMLRCCHSNTLT